MALQVGQVYSLNGAVKTGTAPGKAEYTASGQLKIKNTRQVGGQTYYDIDQTAYGGGTGWASASELERAVNGGGGGSSAPSGGGGASIPQIDMGAIQARKPSIDIQGIASAAYNDPTILAATEKIKQNNELIASRRRALAEASGTINDNPFYSEATRVGRIAKLEDRAGRDINNYINEGNMSANELTRLRAEAENKVNLALKSYDIQRQEYQDYLGQFNMLLQSGALGGASAQDIAQISSSTGISPSMLQSIISTQREKSEVKPSLQTFDDGNQQYVVAIDSKGNVINKQVIGASKSDGSSDDKKAQAFESAISKGIQSLESGASWGTVWKRINTLFPDAPPALIDDLLGTEWRQAGAYESHRQKTAKPTETLQF